MPAGFMRVKRVGAPWGRQYVSVDGSTLSIRDREDSNASDVASLEGSIVRPLTSESHGFVLVVKGGSPTQISCGSAKEKTAWVKAIKAAAAAAKSAAPLSRRPPASIAPRPTKKEALREAILRQDEAAVQKLLDDGASAIEPLADGSPPLCAAVAQAKGGLNIAMTLLEAGAEVGGLDVHGATALMKAARLGNMEMLQVLLDLVELNAEDAEEGEPAPDLLNLLDYKQQSALSLASSKGHTACAELLLGSGASADLVVADGNTALLIAAHEGHADLVQVLLNVGASTTVVDEEEETALMKAAAEGHLPVVNALLEQDPRSIGQHNRDQFSALHYAASVGHLTVVDALLAKGADPRAADGEGRTALVLAAMFGHAAIVARLLGAPGGVDGTVPATKEEERLGLAAAQHEGHDEAASVLEKAIKERRAREGPGLAAEVESAVPEAAAEALQAQEQLSKKLEASVGAMASATHAMESRVSRIEVLLDKVEKTTSEQQRSDKSERLAARTATRTLEERVASLEKLVEKQGESRLEARLARVEQKLTDLSVQLSVKKKRGGGIQEDEMNEKFEWLRAQQEQMLLVMSEAIQRQVLTPEPDDETGEETGAMAGAGGGGGGGASSSSRKKVRKTPNKNRNGALPPAAQRQQEADAAIAIQSVARGRHARAQQGSEQQAAAAIQEQYRAYRQHEFFQNRLSVEEDWAASHIQSVWRTRQQRLFFENRESVERGYAAAAIQKTVRGKGRGGRR
jgi:ankyrin repeat protein